MSNRTYDNHMEREYLNGEYGCCDCGYRRKEGNHPGIRCPQTGRCGQCGNEWPCAEHINLVPNHLLAKVNQPSYVKRQTKKENAIIKHSDCKTVDDFIEFYKNASRSELKARLATLKRKIGTKTYRNEANAINTLLA